MNARLREQHALFEDQLSTLTRKYRGKWVVFSGGEVKAAFAREEDAIRDALKHYKSDEPFIIVQVVPLPA